MKRVTALLAAWILLCALAACEGAPARGDPGQSQLSPQESPTSSAAPDIDAPAPPAAPTAEQEQPDSGSQEGRVLVAYFSATGNTENIAEHLVSILDADLYEIVPEVPYTSEDLNYSNSDCRANQEQNDPTARPAISGGVENLEDYEVVFLGYPIWWGDAPKIISTFLETYDFDGKTIVPFCTSGSSGIGSSARNVEGLTSVAAWLDGQRFSGSASRDAVEQWVNGLGLELVS